MNSNRYYRPELSRADYPPYYETSRHKHVWSICFILLTLTLLIAVVGLIFYFIIEEKRKLNELYQLTQAELSNCHNRWRQYSNVHNTIQNNDVVPVTSVHNFSAPAHEGVSVTYRERAN